MTKPDLMEYFSLLTLVIFISLVLLTVFLVKRVNPDRRALWFFGCSIILLLLYGIFKGPVAILASVAILALVKKENNNPLYDIGQGILVVFTTSVGFLMVAGWGLLTLGGIYWLWLAIQLKSFGMFFLGLFPMAWIVTAPVGAYAWAVETPQWVINTFN